MLSLPVFILVIKGPTTEFENTYMMYQIKDIIMTKSFFQFGTDSFILNVERGLEGEQ